MPSDLRIIIDTNSLISAVLISDSPCSRAVDYVLAQGRLLLSSASVTELTETLRLPKFDRYVTQEERSRFLMRLVQRGHLVEVTTTVRACRDPNDDKFLELAISGRATHLVTGDQDLLLLHPFHTTAIISCTDFLTQVSQAPHL